MDTRCGKLMHNCRGCERHFKREERVPVCPDCGTDLRCRKHPVFGSPFCGKHGGPQPQYGWYGPATQLRTGVSSRFAITRLAAKYNEMTRDGRVLSNRQSIEIIRTRVQQLAARIDLDEAPDRLKKLSGLWQDYKAARNREDRLEQIKLLAAIDFEFEAAYHDYAAWQQMFEALDLDRKLVESEVKIAKELKAILTAEDAYELAAKLLASVIQATQEVVVDETSRSRLLKRIEYEFARLIGDGRIGQDVERPGSGSREILDSVASVVD